MRVAVFGTKVYDKQFLEAANHRHGHDLVFFEPNLTAETKMLASGFPAICVFVNDRVDEDVIETLSRNGTRLIVLRCSGFNNVDLVSAEKLGLVVLRVPNYSPYSVAEHTAGLILTLNRKIHRAYARVREGNMSLEGLLGSDLHGQTVGIVGTGQIGSVVAGIMKGFGCRLLGYDPSPNEKCAALGVSYVALQELFAESDIITLHCPLTPQTRHLIESNALNRMKDGVMLVNTSRGAVVDTKSVIQALKSGKLGSLGLDVYEEEAHLFFEDLSSLVLQDDVFARLLTFPNVVITAHQAYFTRDALSEIANVTLANITEFESRGQCSNRISPDRIVA